MAPPTYSYLLAVLFLVVVGVVILVLIVVVVAFAVTALANKVAAFIALHHRRGVGASGVVLRERTVVSD